MTINYYVPSPAGKSQNLDDLLLYNWQQDGLASSTFNNTPLFTPDDILLNSYNDSKDWSNLDDFDFALPSPLSPLEEEPESPESSHFSISADEIYQQMAVDQIAVDQSVTYCDFYPSPMVECKPLAPVALPHTQTSDSSLLRRIQARKKHRVLDPAEIQALYAIAMPSLSSATASSFSTSPPVHKNKEESPSTLRPRLHKPTQQPQPVNPKPVSVPRHKTAHNTIEKRYRTNINSKIIALSECIPNIDDRSQSDGEKEPKKKKNKATILSRAIEYITLLEQENRRLSDEIPR